MVTSLRRRRSARMIFGLQAEIGRTIAHAKRLKILHVLESGEKSVGEIARAVGAAPANVSQHLSVLRNKGIVRTRRHAQTVYYSVGNPKISDAVRLHREALLEIIRSR